VRWTDPSGYSSLIGKASTENNVSVKGSTALGRFVSHPFVQGFIFGIAGWLAGKAVLRWGIPGLINPQVADKDYTDLDLGIDVFSTIMAGFFGGFVEWYPSVTGAIDHMNSLIAKDWLELLTNTVVRGVVASLVTFNAFIINAMLTMLVEQLKVPLSERDKANLENLFDLFLTAFYSVLVSVAAGLVGFGDGIVTQNMQAMHISRIKQMPQIVADEMARKCPKFIGVKSFIVMAVGAIFSSALGVSQSHADDVLTPEGYNP
jgi:hypothetical protein